VAGRRLLARLLMCKAAGMRQVPDPDRDEWVRRLRERARLDAEELLPRPPFGVFGLAAPLLRPAVLAEAGQADGKWETITLAYGDWTDPAGPYIAVTSAAEHPSDRDTEAELLRAIDRERNRIADHAGVDEDEPAGQPEYRQGGLRVGERMAAGLVCRHGSVWAARLLPGRVTVTVTGRGAGPATTRLGLVADLGPYLRDRGEMLGQLAERYRRRSPPALEPAQGVAAYRALAEAELASQARHLAALRSGREPRRLAGEGATRHALWQRAVSEQARISGISSRHADEIVTLVVNHVTHLQQEAAWFTEETALRDAAIDETLRHAVLGEDVRSKPAQQAWARYWTHRTSLGAHEPDAALRAEMRAGQPLIIAWLQAWSAWTAAR
jgi:hypothetical protein